jgi:hypothetical protein
VEMARRLVGFLHRARHNLKLRFMPNEDQALCSLPDQSSLE